MQNDDDIQLQSYQDDLNTDDNAVDPIMAEQTDDPTAELGVPPSEFKSELDKLDIEGDNEAALDPDDIAQRDDEETFIEAEDENLDEIS